MGMAVICSGARSSLNPEAEPFVPVAYRAVEDFSPEWWRLVESNPWFRDYWIRECFHEPEDDSDDPLDMYDIALSDDLDALLFDPDLHQEEEEEEKAENWGRKGALVTWGAEKWRKGQRGAVEVPKYAEKAPKIVSVKVSPRTIQQPR